MPRKQVVTQARFARTAAVSFAESRRVKCYAHVAEAARLGAGLAGRARFERATPSFGG